MNKKERLAKMAELIKPIDQQIMMCDNPHDLLMFGSALLTSAKHIFITTLGIEATKTIFREIEFDD